MTTRDHDWTTSGSVRGGCGHRHRTITGAARCLERDRSGCRSQGGYSDRSIVRVPVDVPLGSLRAEAIHRPADDTMTGYVDDAPQYVSDWDVEDEDHGPRGREARRILTGE